MRFCDCDSWNAETPAVSL